MTAFFIQSWFTCMKSISEDAGVVWDEIAGEEQGTSKGICVSSLKVHSLAQVLCSRKTTQGDTHTRTAEESSVHNQRGFMLLFYSFCSGLCSWGSFLFEVSEKTSSSGSLHFLSSSSLFESTVIISSCFPFSSTTLCYFQGKKVHLKVLHADSFKYSPLY